MPPRTRSVATPVEVAATLMVERLVAAAAPLPLVPGVVIVLDVADAAWEEPLAEAWERWWAGTAGDEDECLILQFRDRLRRHDDEDIARALARGCGVVGISATPERVFPAGLLYAADWRVKVCPPDDALLSETVRRLTGQSPPHLPPAQWVSPADLNFAHRPGQTAEDYAARLHRLVTPKLKPDGLTLDDIHGMDAAVEWGTALAHDLRLYRTNQLPWSAVDRGALLCGPPGTGKTLFARALAGSTRVPLIAASLAQWQARGHLGDTLKAMRASFAEARTLAPCLLFIDEIDAFGDRASFTHGHRDYSTQVVNALLEELDGFAGREGVVVLAACNRPERLDPALTRPGRLDRTIPLGPPDRQALAGILRHHLGGDLTGIDLAPLALQALGGTGADCERWVRGARRRARMAERPLALADLEAEIAGAETRPADLVWRCAIHEAGHAVAAILLSAAPLVAVTIRASAGTGGGIVAAPVDGAVTRERILRSLRMLMAGRAAEEATLGTPSSGAGGDARSDLAQATLLAATMITALGLEEDHGLLWTGEVSPATLDRHLRSRPAIEVRVGQILAEAYADALDLVRRHRDSIEAVARALVARQVLEGGEVEAIVLGVRQTSPDRRG